MHIVDINIITFTAQIYNALHMQGKKGRLLSSWPLWPYLNPPMSQFVKNQTMSV